MTKLTPEDIKLLEEIKKHPFLYKALMIDNDPEYILNKIEKVLKAFYS